MEPYGKQEVREAVVIAAISAVATTLIAWGLDHLKACLPKPEKKRKKKD